MASISDPDTIFIKDSPLPAASLDPLRQRLKPRDEETASASSDDTTDLSVTRDAISNLVAILQIHPVAKLLRSATRRPLNGQLASIYAHLQSEDFDLSAFEALTTAVTDNAPDIDIWKAVIQLIDSLTRITPPLSKSIPASYLGTPWTRSSASHQGSDQTWAILKDPLRRELKDCSYYNTPGFWARFFEGKTWTERSVNVYNQLHTKNDGDALKEYPNEHVEDDIWEWLDSFQKEYLHASSDSAESSEEGSPKLPAAERHSGALGTYFRTKRAGEIAGGQKMRQLDLFVKRSSLPAGRCHHWKDVLVVGELTSSPKSGVGGEKFLKLALYMRELFIAQPLRRFAHGFLLLNTEIQLWVFDRSGAYGSETFDIRKKPEQFIQAIVGYALMNDEELGVDTSLQQDSQRTTVTLQDAISKEDRTFKLYPTPFVSPHSIVSRGTTCYRTIDQKHVVKFSWRSAERRPESELLGIASGIAGVASLAGSREFTSIDVLRGGLDFSYGKGIKRKQIADHQKLNSANSSFTSDTNALGSMSFGNSKRSSNPAGDEETRDTKRIRSSSRCQAVVPGDVASSQAQFKKPDAPFRNRKLNCLAISPAGRPLREFRSVKEFLTGMRDAIRAHKALFMEGKILHRDISEHNIILTDPNENNGFSGMLIDLDLAVTVGDNGKNERTGARHMTGTLEFMALEVLKGGFGKATTGIEHTYRHDLESFFYVFLAICVRYGWERGRSPAIDPLSTWYTGNNIQNIYTSKSGGMGPAFEDTILSDFSPTFTCLTGLAQKLREILFSKGALFTGTIENPDEVYGPMLGAFNEALQALDCRSEQFTNTSPEGTTRPREDTSKLKRPASEEPALDAKRRK